MAPNIDRDERPDDDDPTERFAFQKCPHCAALSAVSLCFTESACTICGEPIEVAPPRM